MKVIPMRKVKMRLFQMNARPSNIPRAALDRGALATGGTRRKKMTRAISAEHTAAP